MIIWNRMHKLATLDPFGFLFECLSGGDPRSAREQLHANYAHGGGWQAINGFTLDAEHRLCYPGDPPLPVLFMAKLRDETIYIYAHSWVVIVQPDGRFEVAKMD